MIKNFILLLLMLFTKAEKKQATPDIYLGTQSGSFLTTIDGKKIILLQKKVDLNLKVFLEGAKK